MKGTCSVCGTKQDVIQGPNGPWIGHHQVRWPKWCAGSKKSPKEER